jgi:VWFA-related protein
MRQPYTSQIGLEAKRVCGFYRLTISALGFLVIVASALGQRSVESTDKPNTSGIENLEPAERQELPGEAVSVEGLIRLDVTVTDQSGKAIAGLQRSDFKLLDNGQPQTIIAFRASQSPSADADESLSVILFLDTLHLSPVAAAFARQQVEQFLQQNSGKLAQPVTIYSLNDSGFFLTSNASTDGAALANDVASDRKLQAYFLAPGASSHLNATVEPLMKEVPALAGLHALWMIASAQTRRPGRKLLFWIGPGLGIPGTTGAFSPDVNSFVKPLANGDPTGQFPYVVKGDALRRELFQKIRWFSLLLRQSRVTLDCFSLSNQGQLAEDTWRQFVPAVSSPEGVTWLNLFKNVLAVQSGGLVLPSHNGLLGPLNDRVESARIFYTLTFNPPLAQHADEYHSLKIELRQPTLTADTFSGYYDQPFYDDPPNPALQPTTVAQLEQLLHATGGASSAPLLPTNLVLTERLTQSKLRSLLAESHDKKLRETLELLAEQSTFLDLPAAQLAADPPPSPAEQQRMLSAAADYLDHLIPKLPDFFAVRTAIYYRERAAFPEASPPDLGEALHPQRPVIENVLYRRGAEVVDSTSQRTPVEQHHLEIYGTFGPILQLLQVVSNAPGDVTWEAWEKTPTGTRAVFRYRFTGTPSLTLTGCCYPNGGKAARTEISSDSHGEFAIDPATGAILRLQTQMDLTGFVPTVRTDVMVSYGPVNIGDKTYIVPLRSVSIWRSRSAPALFEWGAGFATWGPYQTQMNVFTFDQYHMFRAKSHILPGFNLVPNQEPTSPQ